MDKMLHISVSPHIHGKKSTTGIMLDVIIALLPASVAGVLLFGLSALWVIATCVITAVACEALFNLIVKKEQTVGDLSAIVTGLLLALNLPANIPLWQAAVGTLFAIIVPCSASSLSTRLKLSIHRSMPRSSRSTRQPRFDTFIISVEAICTSIQRPSLPMSLQWRLR